jgi:hypothetical protein
MYGNRAMIGVPALYYRSLRIVSTSYLMMGTPCAFLLIKSSNLPLYYFPFFFICSTMLLSIVDTAKHPVMLKDSIQEVLKDLLQA